jgi:hypothetical protein
MDEDDLLAREEFRVFAYGARHYRIRSPETSSLLLQLFQRYREEILTMPDQLEEFTREFIDRLLEELPAERILKRIPVEKRLEGVSLDDVLAALTPQMREALTRRLKADESQSSPE